MSKKGVCQVTPYLIFLLLSASVPFATAKHLDKFLIQGVISVHPDMAHHIAPDDRLIIKLFHPGADGLELDAKVQIVKNFTLPLNYKMSPSVSMSSDTKFKSYIVEVFTDKNQDVLAPALGELIARTPALIKLGSDGVNLELAELRQPK